MSDFERSMSDLVAAIGRVANSPPTDRDQVMRLYQQVSRLDGISVRAGNEIDGEKK